MKKSLISYLSKFSLKRISEIEDFKKYYINKIYDYIKGRMTIIDAQFEKMFCLTKFKHKDNGYLKLILNQMFKIIKDNNQNISIYKQYLRNTKKIVNITINKYNLNKKISFALNETNDNLTNLRALIRVQSYIDFLANKKRPIYFVAILNCYFLERMLGIEDELNAFALLKETFQIESKLYDPWFINNEKCLIGNALDRVVDNLINYDKLFEFNTLIK
ncbi:hypothetical protein [Mycoplasma sp. 125]|uniref:hypothetical protein n=1 Tax=Mycoplasma sp. 125 TaxID=3447505 RepID=UPI003F657392